MFCILPSAQIKDQVELKVDEKRGLNGNLGNIRSDIRRLSNAENLIKCVSNGEVMMGKKIMFDSYLKAQVNLMKYYVSINTPCPFFYDSFFSQS